MIQNIEQVSHPRDAINKELYDKCMDKLTGRDKRLASLEGIVAITSNPNPNPFEQLMKEVRTMPKKLELAPFDMQPFEWPRYLDRSCMVKFDMIQIP